MKPGWKTSEFWLSVLAPLVTIVVVVGWLTPDQRDTIQESTVKLVEAIAALVTVAASVKSYAASRATVKAAAHSPNHQPPATIHQLRPYHEFAEPDPPGGGAA